MCCELNERHARYCLTKPSECVLCAWLHADCTMFARKSKHVHNVHVSWVYTVCAYLNEHMPSCVCTCELAAEGPLPLLLQTEAEIKQQKLG